MQHFDRATRQGTGIVFNDYDDGAVRWAVQTALGLYADKACWRQLVQNAMAQDYSWARRVRDYEALYQKLVSAA